MNEVKKGRNRAEDNGKSAARPCTKKQICKVIGCGKLDKGRGLCKLVSLRHAHLPLAFHYHIYYRSLIHRDYKREIYILCLHVLQSDSMLREVA